MRVFVFKPDSFTSFLSIDYWRMVWLEILGLLWIGLRSVIKPGDIFSSHFPLSYSPFAISDSVLWHFYDLPRKKRGLKEAWQDEVAWYFWDTEWMRKIWWRWALKSLWNVEPSLFREGAGCPSQFAPEKQWDESDLGEENKERVVFMGPEGRAFS